MYKKIIFWSPLISHVGTINAVLKSALSLSKRSNYKVYIIDVLGEFSSINKSEFKNIIFLNIFNVSKYLLKTGIFSKLFLYLFSILAIPKLTFIILKKKPEFIFSYLVSIVPLFLARIFFKKVKIICSIQGYPKLNNFRLLLWKKLYSRANYIITMTNKTKDLIIDKIDYDAIKISTVCNPIISRKIKQLSFEKINQLIGFMAIYRDNIRFKTKEMDMKRSKGKLCVNEGKRNIIKTLESILAIEGYSMKTDVMNMMKPNQLCMIQELLLRFYDNTSKQGKYYFFTLESQKLNNIEKKLIN
mgnify:CR=1 FL=1